MRIFEPTVPEVFEWIKPIDNRDFEIFRRLDGSSRSRDWTPLQMELITRDDGESLRRSDFPWLGRHVLILRSSALRIIGEHLQEYGELLPLLCDGMELSVFNCCTVVDALDLHLSHIRYFPDSNRIMHVNSHVFRHEVIGDALIFKLPKSFPGTLYATQNFVSLIKESECQGLDFKLLWST